MEHRGDLAVRARHRRAGSAPWACCLSTALLLLLSPTVAQAHDSESVELDALLQIERPAMVGLSLLEGGIGAGFAIGHFALAIDLGQVELGAPSAAAVSPVMLNGRSHQFQAFMNAVRSGVFFFVAPWSARSKSYGFLLLVAGAEYTVLGGLDLIIGAEALIAGLVAVGGYEVASVGWSDDEARLLSRSVLMHLGTGMGLLLAGGLELAFGLTKLRQVQDGNLPLSLAPMGAGVLLAGRF